MKARIAAVTHTGLVRRRNEDAIAVGSKLIIDDSEGVFYVELEIARNNVFLAVADGMGGHRGGDIASRTALEELINLSKDCAHVGDWSNALIKTNEKLNDMMCENLELRGFGTTLAGIAVDTEAIIHFNVGDSRVYIYSQQGLVQLSHDDVPKNVGELSDLPRTSHQITQSLGGSNTPTEITPHIGKLSCDLIENNLLICSDGLTDMIAPEQIDLVLRQSQDPRRSVEILFNMALSQGGRDNISIIIAAID